MSKPIEAVEAALRSRFETIDIGLGGQDVLPQVASIAATAAIDSLFPEDVVVACRNWRTNGDLIYDAWQLGYVMGDVYDITPGEVKSAFGRSQWTRRLPAENEGGLGLVVHNWSKRDFRRTSLEDNLFDTVLYDPPFKLNGDPNGLPELSQRYGVDVPAKWEDRHWLMNQGLWECIRITKPGAHILVKCQDQVVSGEIRWQTLMLIEQACDDPEPGETGPCNLVDRFDMIGHYIPQPMGPSKRYPNGRKQKHAHARPSTLLIFSKD